MQVPKPNLADNAETVRAIVTHLNEQDDSEALSPGIKEDLCKELTKLAEDLAPANI